MGQGTEQTEQRDRAADLGSFRGFQVFEFVGLTIDASQLWQTTALFTRINFPKDVATGWILIKAGIFLDAWLD
jgi:hypothetical protein